MMMNFLDLSAASEEECRLIREILSDTSVVNIADPIESKLQLNATTTTTTTGASTSDAAAATTTTNNNNNQQPNSSPAVGSSSTSISSTAPTSATTNVPLQGFASSQYAQANGRPSASSKQASSSSLSSSSSLYVNNNRNNQNLSSSSSSSANNNVVLVGASNYSNANPQPQQGHPTNPYINSNHTNIVHHANTVNNQNSNINYRNTNSNNINYNNSINHNNGQRKNAHNSASNSGNIQPGNAANNATSGSISNRNRISSMSNVVPTMNNSNNVQPIYSQHQQQFTPQLPSNVIPTNSLYHNNINMSSQHNSSAINSQQQQRANEQGSDRLGRNSHMHTSNNIVSSSASSMTNIGPITTMDQHHSNHNMPPLNMYQQHATHVHSHQVPPVMQTQPKVDAKNSGNKNQNYRIQDNNLQQTTTPNGQPSAPSGQMPQMAGDMNTVIGMDMTTHPQGYAIQAFAPPHPHQMFSGPPIFQPHPYSYLIPYNLPQYVPYVPMPPNSVPPRPQVPPQTNQASSVATNTSHSRPTQSNLSQHHLSNEHYDSSLTSNLNSGHHHSRLDNSRTADYGRIQQGHVPNEVNKNPKPEQSNLAIATSPIMVAEDLSMKSKNKSGSQYSSALIKEKPDMMVHSGESVTLPKTGSPSTKVKDAPVIRGGNIDHESPKLKHESHMPIGNGQSTSGSSQNKDAKDTPQLSASSASGDSKEYKSQIDLSSLEQSVQDPSKRSTNDITEKIQSSEVSSEKPLDHVSSDSDTKNIEANQSSAASKSWADLFKRKEMQAKRSQEAAKDLVENSDEEGKAQRTTRKTEPTFKAPTSAASTKEQRSQDTAKRALDKMAPRIASKVNTINLKHALPFLKPRGFINKGNGCYINATLQALIACPPFYNLMKEIGDLRAFRRENSCTPILDSFAELFLHFPPPLDSNKKAKQGPAEQKPSISSLQAEAIEPKCIYNVLGNIKSECLRGAQEDAEEFLSSVLNGLHEEMISLGEVLHESSGQNQQSDVEDSNDDNTNDDNLWREVGSKNRSLPIRIAKVVNTPIQEIFGGSLFSIRTAGKDRCGHRSPFFDLQLDISDDNVKSVQDAIKSFTSPEIIHDFYCSKTKQKLDAQRKTSLDQLPPILILHLKQFIYTQDCGLKKLMKKIEYPIDFELPESCLHEKNSADKNLLTSRCYKLLAVVYHDGKEAVKGHYLTDVYHIGSNQWIRCDDSNLKAISSPRIENPDAPRTPYLLFYRRLNTLKAQSNNHDNKKKS